MGLRVAASGFTTARTSHASELCPRANFRLKHRLKHERLRLSACLPCSVMRAVRMKLRTSRSSPLSRSLAAVVCDPVLALNALSLEAKVARDAIECMNHASRSSPRTWVRTEKGTNLLQSENKNYSCAPARKFATNSSSALAERAAVPAAFSSECRVWFAWLCPLLLLRC